MLDSEDLEVLNGLSMEWLEDMLDSYKKANLPCQVKEMTKLIEVKKGLVD